MNDAITVLHLTDLHLFSDDSARFNQVDTRSSLLQVLAHVQQHYDCPDVVLITGDLAHDGDPATYQLLAELLIPLNAPIYCVFGNHDHSANARLVYPLPPIQTDAHLIIGNWQIILLDSNHNPEIDSYEGEVSLAELQRVAQLIEQYPDKFTLIAMHHNLPNHDDRGVAHEIRNHAEVMAHFEQLSSIKLVLSGHVHQEFVIVQQGICYFSTPATGYQSLSKSKQMTGEAHGYRWLKLYANGRFETDVRRVTSAPS
jgi:3',5'-cyclic-AMP phosphodiesterase